MFCVKTLTETAKMPLRATPSAAGFDLFSDEYATIPAHGQVWVSTGIAVGIDPGKCGLIWPRSGLAGKGITTDAGVVDSDYRGEVKILMVNRTAYAYPVSPGDRIAQMIITIAYGDEASQVDELSETQRGTGGFGHTGMRENLA